jgi:hypothetical protein
LSAAFDLDLSCRYQEELIARWRPGLMAADMRFPQKSKPKSKAADKSVRPTSSAKFLVIAYDGESQSY